MKSLMQLFLVLLRDVEALTGADLQGDAHRVIQRVKDEGDSFLTISLPTMLKAFDNALDSGILSSQHTALFSKQRRGSALPLFLGGLLERIFDDRGLLRPDVDVLSVSCTRQILSFYKSLKALPTKRRIRSAIKAYIQVDADVGRFPIDSSHLWRFDRCAHRVWSQVLSRAEAKSFHNDLSPRHGPGSTADRITGNQKWAFTRWPAYIDREFPVEEFALANSSNLEALSAIDVSEQDTLHSRVICVPKTAKGPRIIAMEPSVHQYVQQSLLRVLIESIEDPSFGLPIRFTDQSVNRSLALSSSIDRAYSTLDLSEASDRVPFHMVERMFSCSPALLKKMVACRSSHADTDLGTICLNKWASMGSALCFPVLAMYVYTCIVSSRYRVTGSINMALRQAKSCSVYGDDIVVPSAWFRDVVSDLEAFGLKVNASKSFSHGFFRESCGMDAYAGYEVTPTRIRHDVPKHINDVGAIASYVSASNSLFFKGYWKTSDLLRSYVEDLIGPLPLVSSSDAGYLGLTHWSSASEFSRFGGPLQARMVRAWSIHPIKRNSPLDGYQALLKCLSHVGTEPMEKDHLAKAGRPSSLRLKKRWTVSR